MPNCSSCGAVVIWVELRRSGKKMPLNPTPSAKDGNVRMLDSGSLADVLGYYELTSARAHGELLFTSHFATCPKRHEHRRPR